MNRRDPALDAEKKSAVGNVVAGCAIVLVLAILVAIAVPMWIPRHPRGGNVPEARMQLKALYTAQKACFAEVDHYGETLDVIGFRAERGNRYACFLSPLGPVEDRSVEPARTSPADTGFGADVHRLGANVRVTRAELPATFLGHRLGVTTGTNGHFTIACLGNVDDDPTRDVWSISDEDRTDPEGRPVPAGTPWNDVDDVGR